MTATDNSQQQLQHSYSASNLYSQPPPQQQQQQQENSSENNWRNIFDAALVKAQQAVQLDELGETVLATQLYSQAANDLGRVIPMCGSEKKKQSMLSIQAIYLDRVQQLKTATKAKKVTVPAPQVLEEETHYSQRAMAYQQENHHQQQHPYGHQQQQQQQLQHQYQNQEQYELQNAYQLPQEQYLSSQDPYQQQQQQQQQYHPPPPPTPPIAPQTNEKEGVFKLFGKKKSKAQTDDYSQQQQQQQQQSMQDNNYNYATYNDYNNSNQHHHNNNIAGGYISPPYSEPHKAGGSPATLVTPVFMTQPQTPSPTPPITSNPLATVETPEQTTKSSRWKPFGKKKSKSLSAGEASSGPYRPPNDYEIPTPPIPMGAQQHQYQHLVDPGDHADAYSHQQHADWFIGNDDGLVQDEYDHTRYYDDDEEDDVDPYYIADNRGRAQAYEGKDSGKKPALSKAPSKDDVVKESKKKPTLNHMVSSYSNEQSFTPTFGSNGNGGGFSEEPAAYVQGGNAALTDEQMFTAAYDDGDDYEDNQQGQYDGQYQHQNHHQHQQDQYSQQGPHFDPTALMQHQTSQYTHDPSVLPPFPAEIEAETEERSGKNKWFGKKNKKKEKDQTTEKEKYDDVAKRMDEALFGGGGSSSRKKDKSKDKIKDKNSETILESTTLPPPPLSHISEVRMSALPPPRKASLDYDIRQFSFERNASTDAGFMTDGQHQHQQQQQQQQYQAIAAPSAAPLAINSDEIYPQSLTQVPSTPNALMPMNYTPRTVYEPKTVYVPSKKPAPQPEELTSDPAQFPSSLDLGANFQQQQQQHLQQQQQQQQHLQQQQQQPYGTAGSVHSQEDGSLLSPDSTKKSKRPFNLFKSKKSNSKLSLDDGSPLSPTFGPSNDDSKSTHSDKTRKSSIQSSDRKAVDAASAAALPKGKKRESDEYVPYEYQEDVEGPLMERVAVREDRDIIGFVLPVEEIIDYTAEGTDETTALENWDSWVNQLESFEKVLADKGLKKDKGKKAKKSKKANAVAAATASAASAPSTPVTPNSPMSSLKANRSSTFSSGISEHRPMSVSDESVRTSMYSTRSSAIFGAELMSVQQAKRRWWNPKRKEATSVYSVSDSLSVSEQDQEMYLSSLRQNYNEVPSPISPSSSTSTAKTADATSMQSQPDQHLRVTTADVLAVMAAAEERESRERQEALNALLEADGTNRGTSLSLPLPQVGSLTSSTTSTQEIALIDSSEIIVADVVSVAAKKEKEGASNVVKDADEEDEIVAPMPPKAAKVTKAKSTKSKLLPISTPLAQVLKIENPEEMWLYVQQAKTYATTRMNKGDKRSAAIALKRAQALEARWQEIMLELASSEEDEDELLDDEDDDSEEEDESEEEEEVKVAAVQKTKAKTVSVTPLVVNTSDKNTALAAKEVVMDEEEPQLVKSPITPASARTTTIHTVEEEEGEGEDADEERRRMHLRKVTSRSDSAPDMFSKYKVSNKAANGGSGSSKKNTLAVSIEETAEDSDGGDNDEDGSETESVKKGKGKGGVSQASSRDSRLGGDASMEQMLETTNKEYLKYYIQRMKTDTVYKARSGSKFAALEGMKNVKVLQQRLADLEEGGVEEEAAEKEEGAEGGEQTEAVAAA
ncbi:hypothetical protein BGX24_002580 [Mortierella sp. AD032]|nr:hypothetical protein BGX24_002580 [Mortierella sp. AD032]